MIIGQRSVGRSGDHIDEVLRLMPPELASIVRLAADAWSVYVGDARALGRYVDVFIVYVTGGVAVAWVATAIEDLPIGAGPIVVVRPFAPSAFARGRDWHWQNAFNDAINVERC